jgi:hypothetical protein
MNDEELIDLFSLSMGTKKNDGSNDGSNEGAPPNPLKRRVPHDGDVMLEEDLQGGHSVRRVMNEDDVDFDQFRFGEQDYD